MAFRSSKPHFFQPLIPGFEHHFSIPAAFSKYLDGGGRGTEAGKKTVVLRSPLGRFYTVGVQNGRRFKDGWSQFVKEHDLHVGDFLVFRLAGEMELDVMVFDPSVCERKYQISSLSPLPIQVPPPAPQPLVSVKTEEEAQVGEPSTVSGGTPRDRNGGKAIVEVKSGLAVANDNCFSVTFQSDLQSKKRVYLPRKYAKANDLEGKSCATTVVDGQGTLWAAKLASYRNGVSEIRLGRTWKEFQHKNGFKAGDSLSIQLDRDGTGPVVFRVTGSSAPTVEEDRRMIVKEVKMEPAVVEESTAANVSSRHGLNLQLAESCLNPDFTLSGSAKNHERTMRDTGKELVVHKESAASASGGTSNFMVTLKSLKGGFLLIPQEFAVNNGLHEVSCDTILSNERGHLFPVLLKTTKSGKPYFGSGWTELVDANRLRVGDVLRFALIEAGRNPMMKFKVVSK